MTIEIDTEKFEIIEQDDLLCTAGSSHKYWRYVVAKSKVDPVLRVEPRWVLVLHWGRVGLPGERMTKLFHAKSQLSQYLGGRLKDKRRKGYVSTNATEMAAAVAVPKAPTQTQLSDWDLF